MEHEFPGQVFENIQIQNFKKILTVGTEFFHADGQTDMTKLTVAFRNFVSKHKKNSLWKNQQTHRISILLVWNCSSILLLVANGHQTA
jgi:hypothetical protein